MTLACWNSECRIDMNGCKWSNRMLTYLSSVRVVYRHIKPPPPPTSRQLHIPNTITDAFPEQSPFTGNISVYREMLHLCCGIDYQHNFLLQAAIVLNLDNLRLLHQDQSNSFAKHLLCYTGVINHIVLHWLVAYLRYLPKHACTSVCILQWYIYSSLHLHTQIYLIFISRFWVSS